MLPSPTYTIRTPASRPQASWIVNKSVRAWHGCSSSDSPLTTGQLASRANSSISDCRNVRITMASEYALNTRATSVNDSRPLSPASCVLRNTLPPPSWIAAASKLLRVRSEGFSKTSVRTRPCNRGGRSPRACRPFKSAAIARMALTSLGARSKTEVRCRGRPDSRAFAAALFPLDLRPAALVGVCAA